jgi:hypothetical protein
VTAAGAARLWQAEAMLRHDPGGAREALEACFAGGEPPEALEGGLDGRLVTGTLGYGLDVVLEGVTRLWMPWRGKAFDHSAKEGRNLFVPAARPFLWVLWPGYRDLRDDRPDAFTAFGFDTGVGECVTTPGLSVLAIDYDRPGSPWPIRLILDELVHVGDGQHLGQALMRWKGGFRRVAWFALATPS